MIASPFEILEYCIALPSLSFLLSLTAQCHIKKATDQMLYEIFNFRQRKQKPKKRNRGHKIGCWNLFLQPFCRKKSQPISFPFFGCEITNFKTDIFFRLSFIKPKKLKLVLFRFWFSVLKNSVDYWFQFEKFGRLSGRLSGKMSLKRFLYQTEDWSQG